MWHYLYAVPRNMFIGIQTITYLESRTKISISVYYFYGATMTIRV